MFSPAAAWASPAEMEGLHSLPGPRLQHDVHPRPDAALLPELAVQL